MKNNIVKSITRNAIVAAIYVVITVATPFMSFGMLQIRIAEALMLLCFFKRDYIYGLTLGCMIANLFSFMWIDFLVGTLATFLACLCICFLSFKRLAIAALYPVIFNAFIIGAELYFFEVGPFWVCAGFVALGEFIACCVVGYALFMIIWRRQKFLSILGANKNLEPSW